MGTVLSAQSDPDGKVDRPLAGPPQERADPALNMTVVKHWNRSGALAYSDVWGWTAPSGREFAYIGEHTGIWFVETTDPANIKQIGQWSAPASTWRDFTNLGGFVYSVSEHHPGIRIIDMRNPDAPKDLGLVQSSAIRHSHNISADPATNHLYVSGTNQGLVILDANQSRTNPKIVATWRTAYTHDCCVRRGRAYLANGSISAARIMDATIPSKMIEIGQLATPGGYSHNVWVSDDNQLLCHTDEMPGPVAGAVMTVWDISNPKRPLQQGSFDLRSVVHNVFISGRTGYMSHYTNGVQVVDMSNPARPYLVASYDTSRQPTGTAGCWGVYPYADSGLIYASDMNNGLYVLRQDRGHLNRFGKGLPGSNGRVPRLRLDGAAPHVGASKLRLEVEDLLPNAQFYLLIGGAAGQGKLFGAPMHVDTRGGVVVQLQADANGQLSIPAPIPNDQGLGQHRFYMQILARDAGLSGGLSSSRGMWSGIAY